MVRAAEGGWKRFRCHCRDRRSPPGGDAGRPRRHCQPDGRALQPRFQRNRAVSAQRRRTAGRAAGRRRPVDAAVQQRRAHGGRPVHEGAGRASGQYDAGRRRSRIGGGVAGRPAAARHRGRRRHRFGHRCRTTRTAFRPVRLRLYGYFRGLLCRSRGAFRGKRISPRLPGSGYREGSVGAGLRSTWLRSADRLERAARHPLPRRNPGPLPRFAGAVR